MKLELPDKWLFNKEETANTPTRWINFTKEWTQIKPPTVTLFDNPNYNEMISITHIPFYSLCAHHILPFFGNVHVAYVPDKKVIAGLSKIVRIVEYFACRPQTQEKMTNEIAKHISSEVKIWPKGVMVVVEARHLCMEMRGIRKSGSITTTQILRGVFNDPPAGKNPRAEFEHIIERNKHGGIL